MSNRGKNTPETNQYPIKYLTKVLTGLSAIIILGWGGTFWYQNFYADKQGSESSATIDQRNIDSTAEDIEEWIFRGRHYESPLTQLNQIVSGQTQIVLFSASEVDLPADALVIGVVVNEQPRAYLPKGMSEPEWCLAHDNIQGQPITVTYCSWTDCARAFVRRSVFREKIRVGGWWNGQMQILINDRLYEQNSTQIPLLSHPVKRTTWGRWKSIQPKTKIYLGDQAPKEPLRHPTNRSRTI